MLPAVSADAPGFVKKVTATIMCQRGNDLPVSAIMVHGRSFESGFSGDIDLDMIRRIKSKFPGIVLANGGITSPERAQAVLEQTGADGLGIARGTQGRPWIFKLIKDHLMNGTAPDLNWNQIRPIILRHAELAESTKGHYGLLELRKHLAWYVRGFPGAAELRKKLVQFKDQTELERLLPNDLPLILEAATV
jgi:tRNA-dihydrouridine synthase B